MAERKRKMHLSAEERERRREAAKKNPNFGGAQQKTKQDDRAQKQVAESLKDDGPKIYKTLIKLLDAESPTVRLKAAMSLLEIEKNETELQIKEEQRRYQNLGREKLIALIQKTVDQLGAKGVDVEQIISGRARVVGRERIEEPSSEPRRALPTGEQG